MKDVYVVGKKWPEMVVNWPNAKVVIFVNGQSLSCNGLDLWLLVWTQIPGINTSDLYRHPGNQPAVAILKVPTVVIW